MYVYGCRYFWVFSIRTLYVEVSARSWWKNWKIKYKKRMKKKKKYNIFHFCGFLSLEMVKSLISSRSS